MQQLSSEQYTGGIKYNMLEVVWAKITGYPWWPGRITGLPSQQNEGYKVQFIGDNSHAYLFEKKLAPYVEWRDQYSKPKKVVRNFYKSLGEAEELYRSYLKCRTDGYQRFEQSKSVMQKQNQILIQIEAQNKQSQYNPSETNLKVKFEDSSEKNIKCFEEKQINHENSQETPMRLKKKRKISKNRKQQVKKLLKSYGLDSIPKFKDYSPACFENFTFSKKNQRNFQGSFYRKSISSIQPDLKAESVKKIYKLLKAKRIDRKEARKISLQLTEQLPIVNNMYNFELSGVEKEIFHWISTSSGEIITANGQNWQKGDISTRSDFQEQNT